MSRAWQGGSTRQWRTQRQHALKRDQHRCVQCGNPANEVDHITGKAEGGTDNLNNLRTLCGPCHNTHTREQTRRGKARHSSRYPRERHPGLT